mmetsp:Transcript_38741/g.92562  ORF Transcript_38741/g.92562 Transcript_38741/m.92562 type:complete len:290 (+) Transcript_38741:1198-2067(+)
MVGAQGKRLAQAQLPEVGGLEVHGLKAVRLGHRQHHPQASAHVRLLHILGQLKVILRQAHGRIDNHDCCCCFPERNICLEPDLPSEGDSCKVVFEDQTTSVNDIEQKCVAAVIRMRRLLVRSIVGYADLVVRDAAHHIGNVAHAIHQGRLANIWATDHRHQRPLDHLRLLLLRLYLSHQLHRWEPRVDALIIEHPAPAIGQPQVKASIVFDAIHGLHCCETVPLPQDLPGARGALIGQGAHCNALCTDLVLPLLQVLQSLALGWLLQLHRPLFWLLRLRALLHGKVVIE